MAVRYNSALEDGLTEDLVCSLEKPMEAPDLTDAEKAAIHYADLAASNHLAISEETFTSPISPSPFLWHVPDCRAVLSTTVVGPSWIVDQFPCAAAATVASSERQVPGSELNTRE
jgi:hypothetical protein